MKLLIIGFGSIGARHARLASEVGLQVSCVTQNSQCPYPRFASLASACSDWKPDRVVLSNPTADHLKSLEALDRAGYAGMILVEKPLFERPSAYVPSNPDNIFVAYNLRFHPLIRMLMSRLEGLPLYSAEFHAGQYLPDWRPGTDYRQSYSSDVNRGGGVLRDLSHEIDLALWLCGAAQQVVALGGHLSNLEISSDDVFLALAQTEKCRALSISMNYLNRPPQRTVRINAEGLTATLDLIAGKLDCNGSIIESTVDRDHTYRQQLRSFVECDRSTLCSFSEGLGVMRFLAASEQSIMQKCWQPL